MIDSGNPVPLFGSFAFVGVWTFVAEAACVACVAGWQARGPGSDARDAAFRSRIDPMYM